jgi:hypothetical protein
MQKKKKILEVGAGAWDRWFARIPPRPARMSNGKSVNNSKWIKVHGIIKTVNVIKPPVPVRGPATECCMQQ